MQWGDIGLGTIACCADAIAADARFNIRMVEVKNKSAPDERLLDLIEDYERLSAECQRNVAGFEMRGDVDLLQRSVRDLTKGLATSFDG